MSGSVVAGLVAALLVLLCGLGYTFLRPTTYTATSVVALEPRDPGSTPAETVQMLGRSMTAYVVSPDVLGRTAQTSGLSLKQLTDATQVSMEADSANVSVSVTSPSPGQAVTAANALITAVASKASADRLVSPDVVSTALPAAAVPHPPRVVLALASVLAALLVGLLVGYVLGERSRAGTAS